MAKAKKKQEVEMTAGNEVVTNLNKVMSPYGITVKDGSYNSIFEGLAKLAMAKKSQSTYDVRNMSNRQVIEFLEQRFKNENDFFMLVTMSKIKKDGKEYARIQRSTFDTSVLEAILKSNSDTSLLASLANACSGALNHFREKEAELKAKKEQTEQTEQTEQEGAQND